MNMLSAEQDSAFPQGLPFIPKALRQPIFHLCPRTIAPFLRQRLCACAGSPIRDAGIPACPERKCGRSIRRAEAFERPPDNLHPAVNQVDIGQKLTLSTHRFYGCAVLRLPVVREDHMLEQDCLFAGTFSLWQTSATSCAPITRCPRRYP